MGQCIEQALDTMPTGRLSAALNLVTRAKLVVLSCEAIFAERERAQQKSYRGIPALEELRNRYGDPESRKVYMMSRDVEGRWLDLLARKTGVKAPPD